MPFYAANKSWRFILIPSILLAVIHRSINSPNWYIIKLRSKFDIVQLIAKHTNKMHDMTCHVHVVLCLSSKINFGSKAKKKSCSLRFLKMDATYQDRKRTSFWVIFFCSYYNSCVHFIFHYWKFFSLMR